MSQIPSEASRRARLSEQRFAHCPVCTNADVSDLHVDMCEERKRWRDQAVAAGTAVNVPEVTTADLLAHVSGRCHNDVAATLVVEAMLDLGWRPVIGSDPKRLWNRPAAEGGDDQ